MIALDLNHGERFRLIEGNKVQPDIHECIVTGRPKSWQMYPGVVARNMQTGHYIGLGPAYSVKLVPPRTERQTPGLDTERTAMNDSAKMLHQIVQSMEERIGNNAKVEIAKRGADLIIHVFFFSIELHCTEYIFNVTTMTDDESEKALSKAIDEIKAQYQKWK